MKDEKEQLYVGLGHLFYSIAASDGHVAAHETDKLKKLVKEQWMPLEPQRDEAGSDLAYYIEIGYDSANDSHMTTDAAFNRFKDLFLDHPSLFDASTRKMIVRTAKAIAEAFAGKNKTETRMIEDLEELFP